MTEPMANFLIVGTQKGGTTALNEYLKLHPEIGLPKRKELHFFDQDIGAPDGKLISYDAYERHFELVEDRPARGEATPSYMFWPGSIERIAYYNPDMRIIACLRHPTDRAFSHWRMEIGRHHENLTFADAIGPGRRRLDGIPNYKVLRRFTYVERGFYAWQIKRILNHFLPTQVLILLNEELHTDHKATLRKVTEFLSVSPFDPIPKHRLVWPTGQHEETLAIDSGSRLYLDGLYRDDIKLTSKLIGRSLCHWIDRRLDTSGNLSVSGVPALRGMVIPGSDECDRP
jgi:hypothetical protein